MRIPDWLRKIFPTPNYGKWCGKNNTHGNWNDAKPIDKGDRACRVHDFRLRRAINNEEKLKADSELRKEWKNCKPKKMSRKHPLWYRRFYRRLIIIFFKNKYS